MKSSSNSRTVQRASLVAILAAFLVAAAGSASPNSKRIHLAPDTEAPTEALNGLVEFVIVPPFEDARVVFRVDGKTVLESSRAPYRVDIDLGSTPTERRLAISAVSRSSGESVTWNRVLNRDRQPLSIALKIEGDTLAATTTAPATDPIVEVAFYQQGRLLATLDRPPYRIVHEGAGDDVIIVTARTKSGMEVADQISRRFDVLAESFEVRTVPILVSVTDRRGVAQTNLRSENFTVIDNGKEGHVLEFTKAFDQPISVAVLLDASGSMTHQIHHVTRAATRFIDSVLREGDEASVYMIQSSSNRVLPLSKDKDQIRAALEGVEASGMTALYDSIYMAIRELRNRPNRRAIVVLTDGDDTSSYRSFDDLVKAAKLAGIPIYGIAYGDARDLTSRGVDELRFLAAQTGGFVTEAQPNNLVARYKAIEDDLRAQYLIRYQISDSGKSNQWRPVRVRLHSSELTARTILGYFTQ